MNDRLALTRNMKLPFALEQKILELLGLEGLNETNWRRHEPRLEQLGRDMYRLAGDFAERKPSETRYQDAYFAYNFPSNFMKSRIVAREIALFYPELLSRPGGLDLLDIGCGEGAGMFGFSEDLRQTGPGPLSLVGIDGSKAMLERASILGDWLDKNDRKLHTRFRHHDFSADQLRRSGRRYDVVIFANSLVELVPEESIPVDFTTRVLEFLSDDGILVVIEPALKAPARRLMAWRDRITSSGEATVLLPCVHRSVCPLLAISPRAEWCHEGIGWEPPYYLKLLNRRLHREVDRLKFSFLVIARPGAGTSTAIRYRVLSALFKEKGRRRCYVCTAQGRVELIRLDKATSDTNARFGEIHRGGVIQLERAVERRPDSWRIEKETVVRVLS